MSKVTKQDKQKVKAVALRYLLDFVQEDKDARREILERLGWKEIPTNWDVVNDALAELAAEVVPRIPK